jgi:hypothetical protein
MFVTVSASSETAIASEATIAFKAFPETSAIIVTSALSFICSVYPVLVILLVLIKVIISKSSDKKLL